MNARKNTKVKKKSSRIVEIDELPTDNFFRRDVQIFSDPIPDLSPETLPSSGSNSEPPLVKQPSGRSKRYTRSGSVPRRRPSEDSERTFDIRAITEAVRQRRAEQSISEPIISKILTPDKRPLPPPDTTELLLNGIPLSRDVVPPIAPLSPSVTSPPVSVASTPSTSPQLPSLEEDPQERKLFEDVHQSDSTPKDDLSSSEPKTSLHHVASVQEIPRTQHIPKDNMPDYASMSVQEQYQHRSKFRIKYEIMRETWPQYKIPNFDDTVPLEYIHSQYREYVKHIHVRKSADKYKKYLIIFWAVAELICTKIGLNASKFTMAQMKTMDKYQSLLIELGEKDNEGVVETYTETWSVEMRLLWVSMVNLVVFIVIKMLSDLLGEQMATNLVNMFINEFVEGESETESAEDVPKPATNSGFDLGSMMTNLLPLFTGGGNAARGPPPARTGPKSRTMYDE